MEKNIYRDYAQAAYNVLDARLQIVRHELLNNLVPRRMVSSRVHEYEKLRFNMAKILENR